ncbi:MAG: fused MFS/spermidine synthase, partial [Candidatus Anstonellaceae archaeon]
KIGILHLALFLFAVSLLFLLTDIGKSLEAFDPSFTGRLLHMEQSRYQEIEVVDIPGYGKSLILDGEFQLSEADESFYHEALVHPALFTHPAPKNVLIIGGGDGGALREVLKHDVNATLVELDERVIEVSKQYFDFSKGAFENSRAEVIIGDGRSFLKNTGRKFDVIIMDLSDPDNEKVAMLYTKEFYEIAASRLAENGIIVTQAESPFYYPKAYASIAKTMAGVFAKTHPYSEWVPIFGQWGFVMACRYDCAPTSADVLGKVRKAGKEMVRYDADAHSRYFLLDKSQKKALNDTEIVINEDETLRLVGYNLVPNFR